MSQDAVNAIRFGVVFTTRNILNRHADLPEVKRLLAGLDQASALEWAVKHNLGNRVHLAQHGSWKQTPALFEELLADMVPESHRTRAQQVFQERLFISPFSDLGLVVLISLICRYCAATGGQPVDGLAQQWRLLQSVMAIQGSFMPVWGKSASMGDRASLKQEYREQFPQVTRHTLATITQQNVWMYDLGRLHALTSIPEVGSLLEAGCSGMTVADWFARRLGIPATDYELMANIQLGASFAGADLDSLGQKYPALAASLSQLMGLATATPAEVVASSHEPQSLPDAIVQSEPLLIRPLLKVGDRHLVTSMANLFNKFHRGLQYLALAARKDDSSTDARSEFGRIYEGYVTWLMRQWFKGSPVEVISGYWAAGCGGFATQPGPHERDLLLVADGVGYVFEIKVSVPSSKHRRTCAIDDFRALLEPATRQAYHAAQALTEGKAYRDQAMTQPIAPLKRVYPCGVFYEFLPLRRPYSDLVEEALEFSLRQSVFRNTPVVAPMQYFDVQELEMWDDLGNLPAEASRLLDAIRLRAEGPTVRWNPLRQLIEFRNDYEAHPGLVRRLATAAEQATTARLKELIG